MEQLLGDPARAREILGWNPRATSFADLVKIMVKADLERVRSGRDTGRDADT